MFVFPIEVTVSEFRNAYFQITQRSLRVKKLSMPGLFHHNIPKTAALLAMVTSSALRQDKGMSHRSMHVLNSSVL